MKKFAVCVLTVLLLTACGSGIVLPDAEDLCRITVTGSSVPVVIDDEEKIRELLRELRQAQDTGSDSIRDDPAEGDFLQVDFIFRQGGASRLFLREEKDKVIVEQPFQRIYETGKNILNLLG
ncbi:MAG: DUF5301 domain-containing protein [Oscillospiraceae bacterium]|nr:DUF5301 domain-containing protein [Oscillospiraceae bacterium]